MSKIDFTQIITQEAQKHSQDVDHSAFVATCCRDRIAAVIDDTTQLGLLLTVMAQGTGGSLPGGDVPNEVVQHARDWVSQMLLARRTLTQDPQLDPRQDQNWPAVPSDLHVLSETL